MSAELTFNEAIHQDTEGLRLDYTTGLATVLAANIDAAITSRASAADLATAQIDLTAIKAAVDTEVAAILADTGELQADFVDGGRLDLIIDAILADTAALDARVPTDPADQSLVEAKVDTAVVDLKGASNKDLSQVFDLVNGASNPFRKTVFGTVTGAPVAYVDAAWVTIYTSAILTKDTELTGIIITNSGALTAPVYRITDGTSKVFPYGASIGVRSAKLDELQFPARFPDGSQFVIQVNCTAANTRTATLTELDTIEHG